MKIIAFGASSSKKSINKNLAQYAASLIEGGEVEVLDLNDYELPLFSVDREEELGHPKLAQDFVHKLESADLILISFAEHNGIYTAAFKNLMDWVTRVKKNFYSDKPLIFLSTSPGARGAKSVLDFASNSAVHFGGKLIGSLSIPSFHENFSIKENKLTNQTLLKDLKILLSKSDLTKK